jgi:hypothetical protein
MQQLNRFLVAREKELGVARGRYPQVSIAIARAKTERLFDVSSTAVLLA